MQNDAIKTALVWPVTAVQSLHHKEKGKNYVTRRQKHPGCELIYVDYGTINLEVRKLPYTIKTGECFLIPSNIWHSLSGEEGKPFDFLNIVYIGGKMPRIQNRLLHLEPEERRLLDALKKESQTLLPHNRALMLLKLNEFILTLDRRAHMPAAPEKATLPENRLRHREKVVDRIRAYLQTHFSQELAVGEIARHLGLSSSRLRFLIKQETGLSMRQHLRQIRLEAAKRMLRETPDNIDEVCYKIGYQSVPHFCAIFKRATRMTPTEYARSLGEPNAR
jgi:AraC-like DNA-binding protein